MKNLGGSWKLCRMAYIPWVAYKKRYILSKTKSNWGTQCGGTSMRQYVTQIKPKRKVITWTLLLATQSMRSALRSNFVGPTNFLDAIDAGWQGERESTVFQIRVKHASVFHNQVDQDHDVRRSLFSKNPSPGYDDSTRSQLIGVQLQSYEIATIRDIDHLWWCNSTAGCYGAVQDFGIAMDRVM